MTLTARRKICKDNFEVSLAQSIEQDHVSCCIKVLIVLVDLLREVSCEGSLCTLHRELYEHEMFKAGLAVTDEVLLKLLVHEEVCADLTRALTLCRQLV